MENKRAKWGGILTIVGGVVGIIGGIVMSVFVSGLISTFGLPLPGLTFAIPAIVLGVIAIIGGTFALKRKNWVFSLIGAILSIAACVILGPAVIIGILAVIFIVMGKREFA